MIFRQLYDGPTSTYTYLLADETTKEALLIDTVFEQHERDLALLRELGLTLRYTLETHAHADHVTGAWLMNRAVGAESVVSAAGGIEVAGRYVKSGDTVSVGACTLEVRSTPGHTDGCITYVLADHSMAFTGDALLIRGAGRTDFQQGDAARLFRSVREQILSLPPDCLLYPAHDYSGRTVTTVAEERAHNPRLGDGVREEDFVVYMDNLGLPHPKRIDEAVPANLRGGRPEIEPGADKPAWGPVIRTFAGVPQVEPDWVHAHLRDITIVDVRERPEVDASPLKAPDGALVIPLSEIRDRIAEIPTGRPAVTVCPAGARSAQAATILEKAGVERVANLRGGLLEWKALGYWED